LAKKVRKQKKQKSPVERAIGIVLKIIIALLLAIVVIGGVLIYMKYGKKPKKSKFHQTSQKTFILYILVQK